MKNKMWQFLLLVLFVSVSAYNDDTFGNVIQARFRQPQEQELQPQHQRYKRQITIEDLIYLDQHPEEYFRLSKERRRQLQQVQNRQQIIENDQKKRDRQEQRNESHQQNQDDQPKQPFQQDYLQPQENPNSPFVWDPSCSCIYQTTTDQFYDRNKSKFPNQNERRTNAETATPEYNKRPIAEAPTQQPINFPETSDNNFDVHKTGAINPSTKPTSIIPGVQLAAATDNSKRSSRGNLHDRFNTKLFQVIAPLYPTTNVVYSPLSLQTLMAFIYSGAEKNTAAELQQALELPTNKTKVLQKFQELAKSQNSQAETQLIVANKLYYKNDLTISYNMQHLVAPKFDVETEAINFNYPREAATVINNWAAEKTQKRIKNLIDSDVLDSQTNAILLNAIYFKAKWQKEMTTVDTSWNNFFTSDGREVPVEMMFIDNTFRYANFTDLNALFVELPYKDSSMSMIVMLPNRRDGLRELETNLQNLNLNVLVEKLQSQMVQVRLPKFKIQFDTDMVEPLRKLGAKEVFTSNAQLKNIFEKDTPVAISKVQHKAYLEVNEAGSEATAATYSKLTPLSLPPQPLLFTANHPFMFAIRNPQAVYFVGHVVNF